jgi:hypothetical protein
MTRAPGTQASFPLTVPKPRLKQTAKGEKPDDAPPSAADLKPGNSQVHEGERRKKNRAASQPDETVKPGTPDAQGQKAPADQGGQAAAVPGPDGTRHPAAATEQKQLQQQAAPPQGSAPRQEQLQKKQAEPPPQPPAPAAGQGLPVNPPKAQASEPVSSVPTGVPAQATGRAGKGPAGPQAAPPDPQLPATPQASAGKPPEIQVPQQPAAAPSADHPVRQTSPGHGKGRSGPQEAPTPGGGKGKHRPE